LTKKSLVTRWFVVCSDWCLQHTSEGSRWTSAWRSAAYITGTSSAHALQIQGPTIRRCPWFSTALCSGRPITDYWIVEYLWGRAKTVL